MHLEFSPGYIESNFHSLFVFSCRVQKSLGFPNSIWDIDFHHESLMMLMQTNATNATHLRKVRRSRNPCTATSGVGMSQICSVWLKLWLKAWNFKDLANGIWLSYRGIPDQSWAPEICPSILSHLKCLPSCSERLNSTQNQCLEVLPSASREAVTLRSSPVLRKHLNILIIKTNLTLVALMETAPAHWHVPPFTGGMFPESNVRVSLTIDIRAEKGHISYLYQDRLGSC